MKKKNKEFLSRRRVRHDIRNEEMNKKKNTATNSLGRGQLKNNNNNASDLTNP